MNPKYYDKMSELLDALIEQRRKGALDYKEYLHKLLDARQASSARGESDTDVSRLGRQRRRSAHSSTSSSRTSELAVEVDTTVRHTKPDSLGRQPDEGEARSSARSSRRCPTDFDRLDELFDLVKARHEYR